jgi:hypothetical protein
MKSSKKLEVSEDDERVYFNFFRKNYNSIIIALPKKHSHNKAIYSGKSFSQLHIVEDDNIGEIFNNLMVEALGYVSPEALSLCDTRVLGLEYDGIVNLSNAVDKK